MGVGLNSALKLPHTLFE